MKPCSVCGVVKRACDFQVRRMSRDGRTAACRECLKLRDAARFVKEREKRARWSRAYYSTENGKKIVVASRQKWLRNNAVKRACHVIAGNAIKDGRLVKQPCEICGRKDSHAHHDDYSKPLEVRWLCPIHHAEVHKAQRLAAHSDVRTTRGYYADVPRVRV